MQVAWPHEQTVFPNLKQRLGLVFCFPRNCHFVLCPAPLAHRAAGDAHRHVPKAGPKKLPALSPESSPRQSSDEAAAEGGATAAPAGECAGVVIATEPALTSAMEPRFSPDGEQLVFVSHDQVSTLCTHG